MNAGAQRILVTGGAGFIGANLTRALLAEGRQVDLLVRQTTDRSNLAEVEAVIRWHLADLADLDQLRRVLEEARPRIIFHLAGSSFNPPTTDALGHARANVLGTLHLLEAIRCAVPEARLVCTGSAAEYGAGRHLTEQQLPAPATLLGATKAAATTLIQAYARMYDLQASVLRLFTPFGPYERPERLIPHTILSALSGRDVLLTDGRQQRDFLYVEDVIEALLRAAESPMPPGSVINVCSGTGTTVREVVDTILELMGRPVRAKVGALPTRADELWELSGDGGRARALLTWAPATSLLEGLRKTIEWWSARAGATVTQPA